MMKISVHSPHGMEDPACVQFCLSIIYDHNRNLQTSKAPLESQAQGTMHAAYSRLRIGLDSVICNVFGRFKGVFNSNLSHRNYSDDTRRLTRCGLAIGLL